ncbi:peptidylprolyl isomerase [Rhodobacter sp. Har01]|uniref:peptidylprolyl isomerase n=1 Tax=Rhodobacter sp. Har01 TaxID=2883999 RepID=UPI001D089D3B|nr:peptidylprolyl isomerase [Rhodobacter sp. Har01]MCB6177290.1 peptidylprolyl isomerase [Rhodobacter sp. Har01]
MERKAARGMRAKRVALVAALAGWAGLGLTLPEVPGGAAPALAQNLFAPRLYVNDAVISDYEVMQRAMFMQLLRAPGDPETEAVKALTEDKLRLSEAKRLGIKATEQEILDGMNEFASRANLTAEQLVGELQKVGIAAETFRDFVTAGVLWRKVVRERFRGQVSASEADVDKALEATARPRALRVLVSELVIPAQPGNEDAAMALANRLSDEIDSEAEFAAAARRHSAAPTAGRGGRLDWLPLSNLPPAIAGEILGLGAGDVSKPVVVPGAVVLFQLRDVARDETAEPLEVSVEWAEFLVPDDAAEIARIQADNRRCLDLYDDARGLPEDRLTITTASMAEVPRDVALELARLDAGEISTTLSRSGLRRLVMLCGRKQVMEPEPTRDQVREQVLNLKLEGLANGYLEELRAAAFIREP